MGTVLYTQAPVPLGDALLLRKGRSLREETKYFAPEALAKVLNLEAD